MSEADASGQRYKNHLDNSNDSVRFQNLWAGSDFVGRFGLVIPFTHIMSQKCQKLQLRALVGRFGSQNAMVGRLDDLGAGPLTPHANRGQDATILF